MYLYFEEDFDVALMNFLEPHTTQEIQSALCDLKVSDPMFEMNSKKY